MKFKIIGYEASKNLGDYIQTIAAAQFFGADISLIDRELLHINPQKKHALLLSGWFMENPKNWPPHPFYKPQFLSFHLNPTAEKRILNAEGVEYLKKHQPIGCRDTHTQKQLQAKGITAYFSGCLTLALDPKKLFDTPPKKDHHILVLSVFERLQHLGKPLDKSTINMLHQGKAVWNRFRFKKAKKRLEAFLQKSRQPVQYRSQILTDNALSETERMNKAKEQLLAIAQAALVITSRIHTALPAVALGTPVLFLMDGLEHPNQKSRLEGLTRFFTCKHSRELNTLDWKAIQNKKTHRPFVEAMTKRLDNFTSTLEG